MTVIDLRYLRMGVAADLSAANLVLALGQPGYEVDTAQIKIGDGSSAWNALNYFSNGSSSIDGGNPSSNYGSTTAINGGTP